MAKNISKKKKSIFISFLGPMIIVLFVQTIAFVGSMIIGGTFRHINTTSVEMLDSITDNTTSAFERYYADNWTNLGQTYDALTDAIDESVSSNEDNYNALLNRTDDNLYLQVSLAISDILFQTLRIHSVTGSFIAFGANTGGVRYGTYLRDSTPQNNSSESDVRVVISHNDYPQYSGLERGFAWKQYFNFASETEGTPNWNKFYNTPITQYLNNPVDASSSGWLSPAFNFHDEKIMTYSLPLLTSSGKLIGIFGVELDCDAYLNGLLPNRELPYTDNGAYIFGMFDSFSNIDINTIVTTSPNLFRNTIDSITQSETYSDIYTYSIGGINYTSSIKEMRTYPNNSPYQDERWFLISLVPERDLYAKANVLTTIFVITVVSSFLIGLVIIALASYYFNKPIMELIQQINSSHQKSIHFKETDIKEIDDLTLAIENLSHEIVESESKLSNILSLVDLPVIAFEYNLKNNTYFISGDLNKVIYQNIESDFDAVKLDRLINTLKENQIFNEDKFYTVKYLGDNEESYWLDLRFTIDDEFQKSGILVDVTAQHMEKEKLIFERNIDTLTGIYNRRAFSDSILSIFANPKKLKQAAFIMMDLDNLKFINDTYGHDAGDEYLRLTGSIIHESCLKLEHCIYGRRSGDEFYIFLYGFDGFNELSRNVMEILKNINAASFSVPSGTKHRVRISSGISLYPQDSLDPDELMHLADYAMYEAKTSAKGSIKYFDRESYDKNAYIIQNKEALNTLIEKELVEYYFQPIVDLKTAEIFGYESLMRSKLDNFQTPEDIINIAQTQHKLNQLEKLTFFKTFEKYFANQKAFGDKKIFINSFANQIMSPLDIDLFLKDYKSIVKNLVIELTNYDKSIPGFFNTKRSVLIKYGGHIALDNYGRIYNSDTAILESSIDYIKIDMSLIRNINQDMEKVSVVLNLILKAHDKGIMTIAVGVETMEEMEVLIKLGCDYAQGFYFGLPLLLPGEISLDVQNKILEIATKHNKNTYF